MQVVEGEIVQRRVMGRRLAFATIHTVDKLLVDVAFTDTFLENGGGYIFPVNHIISTHAILS